MLTDAEQNALTAFLKCGNKCQTARFLGITEATVRATLKRVERKGHAPWLSGAITPDHLTVAKTTVQYGPDGEVQREWKRLLPNAEAMTDFVDSLCERAKGALNIAPAPKVTRQREDV